MKLIKNKKFIHGAGLIQLFFLIFISLSFSRVSNSLIQEPYFSVDDSTKSLKYLSNEISKIISEPNLKNTKFDIAIYSLSTKKFYFKKNFDDYLTPASVTKLFTSFSALFILGSNFQVKTQVYCTGEIKNGTLNGDIYLVGRGDALLTTGDIDMLVAKIKQNGINKINGNIFADGSYFDNLISRVDYSGDRDEVQATPPITALSIESNVVTVIVEGNQSGKKADVMTIPPSTAFKIINNSKVYGSSPRDEKGGRKKRTNVKTRKHYSQSKREINDFGGPVRFVPVRESKTAIKISTKINDDGKQEFIVTGSIEAGNNYKYSYHISKPVSVSAGTLQNRLELNGIEISGKLSEQSLKDAAHQQPKLLAEVSRPLVQILSPLLKNSDNYLAENIFKMIGANSGKLKDNGKEARQIISLLLDSLKINCPDCQFNDGSGLSRRNRVNSLAIVNLIEKIYENNNIRAIFDTSLSIAGIDGTLKNRMTGTLAENNLHAKTGTHGNVSALAGVVKTLDGESIAFAFIFNGNNVGIYKQVENQLGILLSEFFYFNREE